MTPLDHDAVRRNFAGAAASYEAAAALQREVEDRLLDRLDFATREPAVVLDVGAGPGRAARALKQRWKRAHVVALDVALPMLARARKRSGFFRPIVPVCGEAESLPLADASVDLAFSSLCLQWSRDLPRALDELRRVLRPGGLLLLSTFGPDTLCELRAAWSTADAAPHVNGFADIARFGDAIMAAGFRHPVLDRDAFTLEYGDAKALMRELKAIGASNADASRTRGLTGKTQLARVIGAYESFRRGGVLPATYEVIYAQAFAPEAGQPRRPGGGGEIATFSIDKLRGSRRQR